MRTSVVIIGAGQSGLAMSWHLSQRGVDHVVLERGAVAHTWRTERWESLRLLTPNWQSRLPGGYGAGGEDPDGYRTMAQTIAFLEGYADFVAPPLRTSTVVERVRRVGDPGVREAYEVQTSAGVWRCDAVVLASGAFNLPALPKVAEALPAGILSLPAVRYRSPEALPAGGVLVVGASASGIQIAEELTRSGRAVTLAVGEHVRVPRRYRGRDILWWMDAAGILDERHDQVDDITRARNVASFQLAGHADGRTTDLNSLQALGVTLTGRVAGFNDGKAQFSGSLRNVCALADLKQTRLLNALDEFATRAGLDGSVDDVERYEDTQVEASPPLLLDLARRGIGTVVWATGFRPDYHWLDVPVLDAKGALRHEGGVVTASPGLYALGLPFLRRRKSTLIDGVGDDARELSHHLHVWLRTLPARHVPSSFAYLAPLA